MKTAATAIETTSNLLVEKTLCWYKVLEATTNAQHARAVAKHKKADEAFQAAKAALRG